MNEWIYQTLGEQILCHVHFPASAQEKMNDIGLNKVSGEAIMNTEYAGMPLGGGGNTQLYSTALC